MKKALTLAMMSIALLTMVALANAQDQSTSSKPWLYKPAKKLEEVKSLKTGDEIAWVCPMCKTVKITRVEKDKPVAEAHQSDDSVAFTCPDCGATTGFICILKKKEKTD